MSSTDSAAKPAQSATSSSPSAELESKASTPVSNAATPATEFQVPAVSLAFEPDVHYTIPELLIRNAELEQALRVAENLSAGLGGTPEGSTTYDKKGQARIQKKRELLEYSQHVLAALDTIDELLQSAVAAAQQDVVNDVMAPPPQIQTENLIDYYGLGGPVCQFFGPVDPPLDPNDIVALHLANHQSQELVAEIIHPTHPNEAVHDSSYGLIVHKAVAEAYLAGQLGFEPVVQEGVPKVRIVVPADSTHFNSEVGGQSIGSRHGQFLHGISADHAPQGMVLAWTLGYALKLELDSPERVVYFNAANAYEHHMNPRVKHPANYPGEEM